MRTVDIHEARKNLSRLIEAAASGEAFIIAKDGRPMVKVAPLDPPKAVKRVGFMEGKFAVPDDFDAMGRGEIRRSFGLGD